MKAGGVTQVVECLSSKCEALSSNPSPEKKNYGKKNENKIVEWQGLIS
jgi:hypothetical protein